MRPRLLALLVGGLASAAAHAAPPERRSFTLYKWQSRVGREDVLIARDGDGAEIKSAFAFTDRATPVPLAAVLRVGGDGAPRSFQVWGATSRPTRVDDRVEVAGGKLVVTQRGETRTIPAPATFFVGSAYAPVAVTEALLRYWASHGEPARLPVVPIGEVTVERRGDDVVTDDDGKPRTLHRLALGGLTWGRETVWLDEAGNVAALKGVDAEFDHFEATARGFSEALSGLVSRAAADGMAALEEAAAGLRPAGARGGTVAYVGARLIDGSGAPPVPDAVVVVDGDRIVDVGPRASVPVPAGARTVDVSGKTVLPGLLDMHAHFEQVEWGPLYLAAGVTTVRDCGNELDFITSVRDAVASGRGVGPRILMACIVDGEGAAALGKDRLRSADEIPALVARFRKAGCRQVKIYSSLDPRLIAPLAKAAHAAGMTVTGHVPRGIGTIAALRAGMDMISHSQFLVRPFLAPGTDPAKELPPSELRRALDGLDLASPAARAVAREFAARKPVVDPTLALGELFGAPHDEIVQHEPGLARLPAAIGAAYADLGVRPEGAALAGKVRAAARAVVAALHRAGVPVVVGTDQAVPGFSEFRELELLVELGFTPMEALQAATLVPARAMKLDGEVGTLARGKRADLIVVDGDPLADIRALRRLELVVAAGVAYDPARLWASVGFAP
ncbi:MAG: amidohydrolase family protein [Anaeromyxobacteraceae bacterium]